MYSISSEPSVRRILDINRRWEALDNALDDDDNGNDDCTMFLRQSLIARRSSTFFTSNCNAAEKLALEDEESFDEDGDVRSVSRWLNSSPRSLTMLVIVLVVVAASLFATPADPTRIRASSRTMAEEKEGTWSLTCSSSSSLLGSLSCRLSCTARMWARWTCCFSKFCFRHLMRRFWNQTFT